MARPRKKCLIGGVFFAAILLAAVITVAIVCTKKSVSSSRQHQPRVVTKLDKPKVVTRTGLDVPDRYWGSYRSGDYFGLQTRQKNSPVFGFMWFKQPVVPTDIELRFWCKIEDGLGRYGWLKHDGRHFGLQEIVDGDVLITTSFVKRQGGDHGGEWTARISAMPSADPVSSSTMSFLFFVATNGHAEIQPHLRDKNHLVEVTGISKALGNFSVIFSTLNGTVGQYNYLQTPIPPGLQDLEQIVKNNLAPQQSSLTNEDRYFRLFGNEPANDDKPYSDKLLVHQVTFQPPFDLEVIFESSSFIDRPFRLQGKQYEYQLHNHINDFDRKFDRIFKLEGKGFSNDDVDIAKATLSNMIGSVGYFYGQSLVQSQSTPEPIDYWAAELYTGVPSRSGFPRGFLWDEGFHNLLISRWDHEISKDILGHWLDLMNIDGWIPREQILGAEARSRVPEQYWVQQDTNANPPSFLLTFQHLVEAMKSGEIPRDEQFLLRSFGRLQSLFDWLATTQTGKLPSTYRWRGRDPNSIHQINPQALASGLDDYPRASHPTDDERHVDLRCWIAKSTKVMKDMANFLGSDSESYEDLYHLLSNFTLLEELHWSTSDQFFMDYGLHTDDITLIRPSLCTNSVVLETDEKESVRVVWSDPKLQFVRSFGYVSLFPLLAEILKPDNPSLGKILCDIKNRTLLWTDYGLRSLASNAPLYMKYNSDDGAPYWRGPIWINLNYMVLKALRFYGSIPGPFQQEALNVYQELRLNLVQNMLNVYRNSGYIWEHYNDTTGVGEGAHPFTGWSATLVLIMAEMF